MAAAMNRRGNLFLWLLAAGALILIATAVFAGRARAHDIYGSLRGQHGQLCCGGDPDTGDCAPVVAQIDGDAVVFFIHPARIRRSYAGMPDVKVRIPVSQVVFLPVPGEERQTDVPVPGEGQAIGHFCGRPATYVDDPQALNGWHVYCAFYPPGSI